MQPTRQEMLSAIDHKIARTGGGTGPGETGYYLPVMIGDVLDWMEKNNIHEKLISEIQRGKIFTAPFGMIRVLWKTKRESLDKQSDGCISYIFNLISHE